MNSATLTTVYAPADRPGLTAWGLSFWRRAYFRITRIIGDQVVREAAEAYAAGDRIALSRIMAKHREGFQKMDRPPNWRLEETMLGVRIGDVPSPTGRAQWMDGPSLTKTATLVYVPGGSFVAARSPRVTAMIARVAKAARFQTLICDYRLAPEHPCPAASDDVLDAVEALVANGVQPGTIGLVAESAGAAVALAAAQKLRRNGIRLGAQVFFSPWTDLTLGGLDLPLRALRGDAQFSMQSMAVCAQFYLQGRRAHDPVASPVFGDLAGSPPTLIHTSRTDSLHGDAQQLARLTAESGVPVTLRIWPSGNHVFERFYGSAANASISDAAAFLRTHLVQ